MPLSDEERRRYARHIMLPEFGEDGQARLRDATVMVVGAGGLGSPLICYLAAAGVGKIGIIDHDHVELSNLQRQILHEHGDQGRLKVESAADRISELNPEIEVELHPRRLVEHNARSLLQSYDVVADGSDNFATRRAVNQACVALKIPLVSAAVKGFEGQLSVHAPHLHGGCYQCLVGDNPPEVNQCREVGVAGPVCGIMGSMQALEVIKLLIGRPQDALIGKLLRLNTLTHRQKVVTLPADPSCVICNACTAKANSA